jgi:superfamily II DNA or RNA helicase
MVDSEKLKNEIQASFKMLGYEARGNQEQIVYEVLDLFLNKNKRNVVLGAPTGAGKSLLGAVISDCINKLTERESGVLPSIIAMGTNSLAKQYSDSFSHLVLAHIDVLIWKHNLQLCQKLQMNVQLRNYMKQK